MLWILDSRNWISDSWSMDLGFRFSIVFYSRFWKLKIPKPWFPHSGFYWQEKITWILKGGGGLQENFLRPFGPQFGLRIRGGGLPGPLPWIHHCTGRSPAFDWDKTEHYSIPLRELPIYPSPKPTLTLASHLGHVGLGEGLVGSFPETYIESKKLTVLNTFPKALSNLSSLLDTSWPRFQAHRFKDHYIRNGIQPDWCRFCKKDPKIRGNQRKVDSKINKKVLLAQSFDDQRKYLIKFEYDSP